MTSEMIYEEVRDVWVHDVALGQVKRDPVRGTVYRNQTRDRLVRENHEPRVEQDLLDSTRQKGRAEMEGEVRTGYRM